MEQLTIFTDGGARGNPGPAAIGVFIKKGEEEIMRIGLKIGETTNNVAEYTSIIKAYEYCLENKNTIYGVSQINFFMDSELAVRQLNGIYKMKSPKLRELLFEIKKYEQKLSAIKIYYMHIPRELNKIADSLVNLALDNKL